MTAPASESKNPSRSTRRRWVWVFFGGCVAGASIVLGLLLAPPVQGWLLRRAVATQPGWRVEFESFGVGLSGVEARGLRFSMPGVEATAQPLSVRIAPGRLLTKRELQIERVAARKVRVVLTPAELAASAESAAFSGILDLLQSPVAWLLDEAQFDGEIAVRNGDETIVVGVFSVNGGKLSAATPGKFTFDITIDSVLLPAAPENKVHCRGTVRLTQTPAHGVARIDIEGDLALPRYGALALPAGKFSFAVTSAADGEDYQGRLAFGDAAAVELKAALRNAVATLAGRVDYRVEDAGLLAAAAGEPMPGATVNGGVEFSANLGSGDVTAKTDGAVAARDFGRMMPELDVVDAFTGRFEAALAKRGEAFLVEAFELAMRGEASGAEVRVNLTKPVDVSTLPETPVATVMLEKFPITWANPWLASAEVTLGPAEFGGRWSVAIVGGERAVLVPAEPCVIESVVFKPWPIPAGTFSLSPRIEATADGVTIDVPDFSAESDAGERMSGRFALTYAFETEALGLEGEMRGAVPTVPVGIAAKWSVTQTGDRLDVSAFKLEGTSEGAAMPPLLIEALRPMSIDLTALRLLNANEAADVLRMRLDALPLDWISQWIDGYEFAGTLRAGESVLRASAEGSLALSTREAWRITGAKFAVGGRAMIEGAVRFAPTAAFSENTVSAQLEQIDASDSAGNRLAGEIAVSAQLAEEKASVTVALDASLPALPHSEGTFGPLTATLRAQAHNETDKIVVVDAWELTVRDATRDVLSLVAPQPFLFGLSNTGMFTVGTIEPLRLSVGELPLAWLKPWVPSVELEGVLQPAKFAVTAQMTKFLVRPLQAVQVRGLGARVGEREFARELEFGFFPGLDLTLLCVPLPEFQLVLQGAAHVTAGSVEIGGRHAVDLDAAFSFIGNDQAILPSGIELTARADFAALASVPALAGRGLPARGTVVTRLNGDMLGKEPLEMWTRLEGVPAADGSRMLPALEVETHGKVALHTTFAGDVAVRIDGAPRPSEVRFEVTINPQDGNLQIASALRSEFFDAAEALAWMTAFEPKAAVETLPADDGRASIDRAKAGSRYAQLGVPFWSVLRGHFDLEIGTVQFAPYRIDGMRGRLDVRDRELVLSNLSGAMFAGRWGGNVRIDYRPENEAADHALRGEFHIAQFDSARVVQTVFPEELSSVEAKIDVRSTVRSEGNALFELLEKTEGDFTVEGAAGVVRLKVPKQEMAATAAVFGGALLLSPELRALGRLLRKFAEMPVDQIRISGQRGADGEVTLNEFRIDSPQARLSAHGRIPAVEGEPLMNRPLELSIDLAAKDEMAVILGGMSLIEKKPREDGFRPLKETFRLGGKAGEPDTGPLYDLLAKAVTGSKGTWGFLMRKVQNQVNKVKAPEPRKTAAVGR